MHVEQEQGWQNVAELFLNKAQRSEGVASMEPERLVMPPYSHACVPNHTLVPHRKKEAKIVRQVDRQADRQTRRQTGR